MAGGSANRIQSMKTRNLQIYSVHTSVASFSPNLSAIYRWPCELHVLPYKNSRTAATIFMNNDIDVVPLEGASN